MRLSEAVSEAALPPARVIWIICTSFLPLHFGLSILLVEVNLKLIRKHLTGKKFVFLHSCSVVSVLWWCFLETPSMLLSASLVSFQIVVRYVLFDISTSKYQEI